MKCSMIKHWVEQRTLSSWALSIKLASCIGQLSNSILVLAFQLCPVKHQASVVSWLSTTNWQHQASGRVKHRASADLSWLPTAPKETVGAGRPQHIYIAQEFKPFFKLCLVLNLQQKLQSIHKYLHWPKKISYQSHSRISGLPTCINRGCFASKQRVWLWLSSICLDIFKRGS